MKKLFFLIFIVLLFSACTVIVFDRPQPVKAKVVERLPVEMTGVYFDPEGDTAVVIYQDSVLIPVMGLWFKYALSDTSVQIRKKGNLFVMNVMDSAGYWTAYPARVYDDYLLVYEMYFVSDSDYADKAIAYLKKKYNAQVLNENTVLIKTRKNKDFYKLLKDTVFVKYKLTRERPAVTGQSGGNTKNAD